jgi:AcrR family transcriptional regulator
MGRREDNKQRVRQQILDTALALYREHGVDHTRVHDIIERVGISEKTFFNYFPNKLAILEASARESLTLYRALLEYEVAHSERPVPERLAEIIELWAQTFTDDREFLATVAARTPMFFGAAGAMRDQQHDTQLLLAELLRQGQQNGQIRSDHDAVQLAELLTANLLLTTLNWLDRWWQDDQQTLLERLQAALNIFLTGVAIHNNTTRPTATSERQPDRTRTTASP